VILGDLALAIALGENGERENPPGSNRGARVDVYLRSVGLDPARGRYPWCAAFVCWAIREAMLRAGGPHRWRGSASVSTLLARNRALVAVLPAQGDVFIHLGEHGNHCGFVTGTRAGSVTTLEGNTDIYGSRTGGQVMQKFRPPGYTAAFLRPG
jgi:hypothetical protein